MVFDCSGDVTTSSGSFERCDLDIYIDQWDADFDGVVFRNGAFTGNGSLRIRGNFAGGGVTGNQYAPGSVTPAGTFQYNGPAFTASGTAWWYGQGIYTLSLG